jgi:hypothetical protein
MTSRPNPGVLLPPNKGQVNTTKQMTAGKILAFISISPIWDVVTVRAGDWVR